MATPKKYICAFCARAFTRSEHKQRHERSHTNEKPYHCLHCTSSFVRRDLLQRHCRTVHNIQVNSRQMKSPKECVAELEDMMPSTSQTSDNGEPQDLRKRRKNSAGLGLGLSEDPEIELDIQEMDVMEEVSKNNDIMKNHDLIHLLSITRKLETILVNYDPSNAEYNLNDYFLIGYVKLLSSSSSYMIFDKMLKDLLHYLNSFNLNHNHNYTHDPSKRVPPNNYKIGIVYAIISLGYISNNNPTKSLKFFNKSWDLLIQKLIPNYNNNNNLFDQIDILSSLFLLSFIYLNHNLSTVSEMTDQGIDEQTINNDIILNYLNDISYIIISNLNNSNTINENIIDLNLNLFWNIYIFLSTYLKSSPPKFYYFFIKKNINNEDLFTVMNKLSKSHINLNVHPDSNFMKMIVIATLSNELKLYNSGENFLIFSSKNCLHNAIILINKSINVHKTLVSTSKANSNNKNSELSELLLSTGHNNQNTSAIKLFELFKKNVIINSPLKFHELLNNYLFIPSKYYNWELLNVTLQEITTNASLNSVLMENLLSRNQISPATLVAELDNFFNYKQAPIEINNNLSIISFPVIFFTGYLNLGLVKIEEFNGVQLNFLNVFIIQWYLIMNKILLMIWNNPDLFEVNYILQNVIYFLLDNKKCLQKKLKLEAPNQQAISENDEEFLFNKKWFWILKMKFDSIFESWMDFIKSSFDSKLAADLLSNPAYANLYNARSNNISLVRMNISKYLNDLIVSELQKLNEESATPTEISQRGQVNNLFINYSNSYNNGDIDAAMAMQNFNTRRSNSITLGILASNHENVGGGTSISPVLPSSSGINTAGLRGGQFSSNYDTTNNGSQFRSPYSSYPPPPPANTISHPGNSNTGGTLNDLLLPPIIGKNTNTQAQGETTFPGQSAEQDGSRIKPLVPSVVRKEI